MKRMTPSKKFPNITALGNVTTPWGGKTNYENFHPGVDIAAAKGTPIKAPADGQVIHTSNGKEQGDAGYGNSVMIRSLNGDNINLGHLQQALVRPGQQVKQGTPIGTMGNSGAAYSKSGEGDGTHLDIRVVNRYNKYKNPQSYLNNLA